jgi:L-amino acid N-acyltransferase YncA
MTVFRPAAPDDAMTIAEIYVDSWRSTYAGLLPDDVLLRLDAANREVRWWRRALSRRRRDLLVYVAEQTGHGVVGFASGGPSRGRGLPHDIEIYTLYLRDEFQGLGLGKQLFLGLSERLVARSNGSLVVWVLDGNPARYFYEAMGGKCVARRNGSMGGAEIEEVAYGWEDVRELIELGKSG